MSRAGTQTALDLDVIAVAAWFLVGSGFEGMPARGLLNAVALFVIASSAWRILARHRGRP